MASHTQLGILVMQLHSAALWLGVSEIDTYVKLSAENVWGSGARNGRTLRSCAYRM
jgi:hypothetical protein